MLGHYKKLASSGTRKLDVSLETNEDSGTGVLRVGAASKTNCNVSKTDLVIRQPVLFYLHCVID